MRFGVREICDVVFKAKAKTKIGNQVFEAGQPVLYIDTAKTSTIESGATSVYATGGKGNVRLLAWEGEKTLTFTVEDALLSPIGFAVLAGAGIFKDATSAKKVHVHSTAYATLVKDGDTATIDLSASLETSEKIDGTAPLFIMNTDAGDGSLTGGMLTGFSVSTDGKKLENANGSTLESATVFVDFYIVKSSANVSEIQIDAGTFGGYYYVEASTLFKRQSDGVDMPAEITLPNVKIQSNFTFSMASTGDPSTFSFVMDAFPGYTIFDKTKKVICLMQVVEDAVAGTTADDTVMGHAAGFDIEETKNDSLTSTGEVTVTD